MDNGKEEGENLSKIDLQVYNEEYVFKLIIISIQIQY